MSALNDVAKASAGPLVVAFAGGDEGPWRIDRIERVVGETLPQTRRLAMIEGLGTSPPARTDWVLRGVTSNGRYANRQEIEALLAKQQALGRPEATQAALIPIRKTAAWWALAQDERRNILEEVSRHIEIGLEYLPAVSRRLHHGRDLGEPFDFLTWFEYAPEHATDFETLVRRLRRTEEWRYVDREVDVRLTRL